MSCNKLPQRNNTRLREYDYTSDGAYHVIICTKDKKKILSEVATSTNELETATVVLSEVGKVVEAVICEFDNRCSDIHISEYCIMPNHIHLMIEFGLDECQNEGRMSLSSFVSQLKGKVSKTVHEKLWQNGYYEHIIRGEKDYRDTLQYILDNPIKWATDDYF